MSRGEPTHEQRAVLELGGAEGVLSAAAGAGKTFTLVQKVVRGALASGDERLDLSRLLAVTFTNKAAAELKERLHKALQSALQQRLAQGQDASDLRAQMAALNQAQISTFHSFCREVLRRFGAAHGVPAGRILANNESKLLRHEICGEMLEEGLAERWDLNTSLFRGFGYEPMSLWELAEAWGGSDGVGPDDLSLFPRSNGLRTQVLRLHDFMCSLPEPDEWFLEHSRSMIPPAGPVGQEVYLAQVMAEVHKWASVQSRLSLEFADQIESQCPGAKQIIVLKARARVLEALASTDDWEQLIPNLEHFKQKVPDLRAGAEGKSMIGAPKELLKDLTREAEVFKKALDEWREVLGVSWEQFVQREATCGRACTALWELARRFDERFRAYKSVRDVLDFSDLERYAYQILRADNTESGGVSPTAVEIQDGLDFVLVDEYQDTSPLQDSILDLVTPKDSLGGWKKRLIVGDIKQSIYGFRLADPEVFAGHIVRGESTGQSPTTLATRTLKLTTNFRSRPHILHAVNCVFDGLMTNEFGGQDYSSNRLHAGLALEDNFGGPGGLQAIPLVQLHLVVKQRVGGDSSESDSEIVEDEATRNEAEEAEASGEEEEEQYDEVTGAFVARKVASILHDAKNSSQFDWSEMAVLVRSTVGALEHLRRELERHGIPCSASGRSGFYERPEISSGLALLKTISNPMDDVAFASALIGPACGISHAELLELAAPQPPNGLELSLWERISLGLQQSPQTPAAQHLGTFLTLLDTWRAQALASSVDALLHSVYRDSGLKAAAAAMHNGKQRLRNITQLIQLAREFSSWEQQGLSRFLRYLRQSRRATGDAGEAPPSGEGESAVRVMTVHQSKGLEFPVVVLAGVQARFNLKDLDSSFVFSRRGGLGARFITLRGDDPRREQSLARMRATAQRRMGMVCEEMRLLYVAMTRAQERLELVAAVGPKEVASLPLLRRAGSAANSLLDWLCPQLAPAVREAQAAYTSGGYGMAKCHPCEAAPAGCWQVNIEPEVRGAVSLESAQEGSPTSAELDALSARLSWRYGYEYLQGLPTKLSVTALTKLDPVGGEDRGAELVNQLQSSVSHMTSQPLVHPLMHPASRSQAELTPAEYGTAVHKLLAEVSIPPLPSTAALEDALQRLLADGRLEDFAARRISCTDLARAFSLLEAHLPDEHREAYRELPFGLLVPGLDISVPKEADGLAQNEVRAGQQGQVYVQGVIDLLLRGRKSALIVDYKTDRGAGANDLHERYRQQLEWYVRAAQGLLPDMDPGAILWCILGLDQGVLCGPFTTSQT